MKKRYKAYATGCPYCEHWGPETGCWPCVWYRPGRLAKKVSTETYWALKRAIRKPS